MKQAIKLGLIYAAISILSVVVMMLTDFTILFSGWSFLISFSFSMIILIIGGRMLLRNRDDIYLSYGSAVKYLFVAGIIGFAVSSIVTIPFFDKNQRVIDGYMDYQKKTMVSSMKMVNKLGIADEEETRDAIEEIEGKIESGEIDLLEAYPYTWRKLPINLVMGAIMALIYALISAVFVKVKYN